MNSVAIRFDSVCSRFSIACFFALHYNLALPTTTAQGKTRPEPQNKCYCQHPKTISQPSF